MKEEKIDKICPTCGYKMWKRTSFTEGFQDIVCKNCYMNTEILKGGYRANPTLIKKK